MSEMGADAGGRWRTRYQSGSRSMTRSGFVAMIVGSGLALGQLVALPAAADDAAARRQALEPYFRNYRQVSPGRSRQSSWSPVAAALRRVSRRRYTQEPQRGGDRKDTSWSLSITSRHAGCPTAAV